MVNLPGQKGIVNPSAACLCPIRINDGKLETLVTRRTFFNHLNGRPMIYPGEWVFGGGSHEESDADLLYTAVREFREELNFYGFIYNTRFFHADIRPVRGNPVHMEFYTASVEPTTIPRIPIGGEIIDAKWWVPSEALDFMDSEEFVQEQLRMIRELRLDDAKHGKLAINVRQVPKMTLKVLEEIISSQVKLMEIYK